MEGDQAAPADLAVGDVVLVRSGGRVPADGTVVGRLVAQAQAPRSRAQVLADRAAALLFWVAVGTAMVTRIYS